jgi:pimeloyl-ACP methyl ester carboxylesterase
MRLAEVLRKYSGRDILLIAHSMGSIISFDVLSQTTPDVNINTLVTIGSPLGMPLIIKKILVEQGRDFKKDRQPVVPDNIVKSWYNFSDTDDPVAINYNLADDYRANSRGIAPKDCIIYNNYVNNGDRSPHKLYGYLRAPEVSHVIYDFCTLGIPPLVTTMKRSIGRLMGR